jgi:hypothetical protein
MITGFKYCLILLFCINIQRVAAQEQLIVNGNIIDSVQGKPLAGATVLLFYNQDSGKLKGTMLSDEKGFFQFHITDTGSHTLQITHAGFGKMNRNFRVYQSDIRLGDIHLLAEGKTLNNVTVNATKKVIEVADDRIIYNVENDPLARSQMAIDILRRTPSMSVDGNDNVRMNGQTNFRVLLNGRETAMFSRNVSDALKGFPGSSILRIEVINNPSARYDAEGIGGIINIITKKKIEGYNGNVSTWNSSINQHVMSSNFNAKFNKIGIAFNYGIQTNVDLRSYTDVQTTPTSPAYYTKRFLTGETVGTTFSQNGSAELSWFMDSLNTLSLFTNVSGGRSNSLQDLQTTTLLSNSNTLSSDFELSNNSQYPTTTIGTDLIKKFAGQPKKELTLRFNAELGNSDAALESKETNTANTLYLNNKSDAENFQYTIQTDFIQPLGKNRMLEIGGRTTLRRAASDFESRFKNKAAEAFQINPANSDNFTFNQDVFSAYASYSFKVLTFNFRTGLRVEHTRINGNFESSKPFPQAGYSNFLPNLQVSKRIKNLSLVLSYNQRLQRPDIRHLNPFIQNNDSFNVSFGNPQLDAQTIHVVTLQSNMSKGKTSFGFTFSNRFSDNMIVSLNSFDLNSGKRSSTFYNLGKDFHFQVNGYLNTKLGEKVTPFMSVNFQFRKLKNIKKSDQQNSGIAGNTYLGATYAFNSKFNFTGYAGFEQTIIDLQSTYSIIPYCGTGLNYDVVPKKLRVGLMAQNYFARYYDYRVTIKGANFTTVNINQTPAGKIVFTANWNFGKLKESVSRRRGVTVDDRL